MKKAILRKYANLIAESGVNVHKGQEVTITADLDQPEFVKMVVEECYKLGASKVIVDWSYQSLTKTHVRYRSMKTLATVEKWEEERMAHSLEVLPCRIYLESEDPDGLKGINQKKYSHAIQERSKVLKPYRDKMENRYQWCIAAVPGEKWAKKLFPELSKKQAIEKLWEKILMASRVTEDPIQAWKDHNAELTEHCRYLTSLGIESLHYESSNGTNFTVGLIPQGRFEGGGETCRQGIFFNPNIPTEECFTSPMRGKAEGIVYATKPLSYQGELIDKFWIRFKEGKAVEWDAQQGKELLTKMITMDEGSAYLGECALVPYDSPINNSGILFYNTLFDENAVCHLALGHGFNDCIQDFENYSDEECKKMGVNDSIIHVDFMIGSPDLNITAKCRDGRTVKIFENGNWAKR